MPKKQRVRLRPRLPYPGEPSFEEIIKQEFYEQSMAEIEELLAIRMLRTDN